MTDNSETANPAPALVSPDWNYLMLLYPFCGMGIATGFGAIGLVCAEVVLWLKFGERVTLSPLYLLEYNGISPSFLFPATEWVGVQKIIVFIINTPLWLLLIGIHVLLRATMHSVAECYHPLREARERAAPWLAIDREEPRGRLQSLIKAAWLVWFAVAFLVIAMCAVGGVMGAFGLGR